MLLQLVTGEDLIATAILWLAYVDISPNPDPFNFWTSESEYIKKTGIRIHFFQN